MPDQIPDPDCPLFDLDEAEVSRLARLAELRLQWHGFSEPQREHLRGRAHEMGFDIAPIERPPTEQDIEAMLIDCGRDVRREPAERPVT